MLKNLTPNPRQASVDTWFKVVRSEWGEIDEMRATLRGGADLLTAINYLNHEFSGHTQEIRIEALDVAQLHQFPSQSKLTLSLIHI